MRRVLNKTEVVERMSDAKMRHWRMQGDTLHRIVEAHDFPTAVRIIDKIVPETQKLDRRPDIDLHDRRVHFAVHSDGGLTDADVELAHRIEMAAGAYTSGHD